MNEYTEYTEKEIQTGTAVKTLRDICEIIKGALTKAKARKGELSMLKIKRDKDGNHFVDGKPYDPTSRARLFKKKTLTYAIHMREAFSVETLEGTTKGKVGDFLMVGATGEMYPCDAAVFEKSYELA